MSNFCQIVKPSWMSNSAWQSVSATSFNPQQFKAAAINSLSDATAFVFDADSYFISCVAFPSAGGGGDTLIAIGARVAALETANVNLQNQVTALSAGSLSLAPNGEMLQAQAAIFGVVLVAACVVYGLKQVYNLFRSPQTSD